MDRWSIFDLLKRVDFKTEAIKLDESELIKNLNEISDKELREGLIEYILYKTRSAKERVNNRLCTRRNL